MKILRFLLLALFIIGFTHPGFSDDQLHSRPRYTLRNGDSLTVDYRYTPEFNQTVVIQPDGFVDLTIIGELKVSGLTLEQVRNLVTQKAAARLKNPEINIVLKEFERPYVVVSGEVDKPGRMDFYEHTTALQAVMLAGGFKETAQESQVLIFRRVNNDLAKVLVLNLHKVKASSDLERDMVLEQGDIVLVPRNKLQNVARFVKATNLGLYLDPLTYVTR
ncbi:polysaccharide biosynthesis/export family protein [Granulicella arctica]|uniref:polysaccharide biosynthesis/export family protein n=1 Tax=Granulicella arctica TaxID=940613 RepID=UPI0021DFBD19|nr:polysaccharide biosynthesis/export family protein [Granulicella arctica]